MMCGDTTEQLLWQPSHEITPSVVRGQQALVIGQQDAVFRFAFRDYDIERRYSAVAGILIRAEAKMDIKKTLLEMVDAFAEKSGIAIVSDLLTFPEENADSAAIRIKGYRQTDTFSCGFVAGMMAVHHFFPKHSIDKFYQAVSPDSDTGTSTTRLTKALRSSGLSVGKRENLTFAGIEEAIKSGFPIITTVARDREVWHWVLIYGVSQNPKRVYIAGNSWPIIGALTRHHEMAWSDFKRLWRPNGFGLICSKKATA